MYRIKGDEFFLDGHFPGNPIVPGVILCEILAQSACCLIDREKSEGKISVYAGLDKVRFKSPVFPGDEFRTKWSSGQNAGSSAPWGISTSVKVKAMWTADFA